MYKLYAEAHKVLTCNCCLKLITLNYLQNKECFTYIGDQNSNVLFQKYSIYALDLGL